MKLLVDGRSFAPGDRIESAALGLALRGHELGWLGPAPAGTPSSVRRLGLDELARWNVDAVIGGATPFRTVLAGWLARAHVLVLGLAHDPVARWSVLDRWGWHGLYALGLVDEAESESWRGNSHGLEPERLALWSSAVEPVAVTAEHPDTEVLERACERALARQRGRALRAGAFLDRDGTLVREVGYPDHPDQMELLPGAAAAVRRLRASGAAVVVISNQAGVGRGLFPLSRVYETMARLRERLRAEGAELDAIYFCPHRPDEGCACRKPGTALLERAADDLLLSLRHSVFIGDKRLDAATGQHAGGAGVLVRTGYGREEEAKIATNEFERPPDQVCDDVAAAADWWLERP